MKEFSQLVWLMEQLRSDTGCSWDRKQTVDVFKTFMLEEVYEVIDAIEKNDYGSLKEELGDLLFHIVFVSQICREMGLFDIGDVLTSVYTKMYHRHPHVFNKTEDMTSIEQKWEQLKQQEKPDYSPMCGIPLHLPALLRAYIISKRASRFGFDWEELNHIYEKMHEEIEELKEAQMSKNTMEIKEEIGDLLFTIANIARFQGIDPEDALRQTTEKFIKRFRYIENKTDINNASSETMNELWIEAKSKEKEGL